MINSVRKVGGVALLLLCPLFFCSSVSGQDCSKWATDYHNSVISLTVEKTKKETGVVISGSGTGFIVSGEGYVLTAYHVVARELDTDSVEIKGAKGSLYGQNIPMRVIVTDPSKDLALLSFLDESQTYTPIPLSNPSKVQPGWQLCSLSYSAPLGVGYQAVTGTLSSRKGADLARGITTLWTTQMPSNPGVSGAPVLDITKGGVVALMYGGIQQAQNVNFVIPINLAATWLRDYCNVEIPQGDGTSRPKPEPTLESVQVRFALPGGDDKEFDTAVAVQIIKGNTIIASGDDIAGNVRFQDSGNYGPFDLAVQSSITKAVYSDSLVRVSITPVGHDTWTSRIIVVAKFSDNSQVKKEYGPFILDEDIRQTQFKNP
jgi:S1-C subfamily serine protease